MNDHLKAGNPVQQLCEVLAGPTHTYYYQSPAASDEDLITAIEHSVMRRPYYSYRHRLKQRERQGTEVRISMTDTGQPAQNGLVERVIGIVKHEHVVFTEYEAFDEAFRQLKHWLEIEYMTDPIHSALAY